MTHELTLAEKLFAGNSAESNLEENLVDAGVEFEKLGWDWYDCSLEIRGVSPADRLSVEAQKVIHKAGFCKAYVNHTDNWETHYRFKLGEEFAESPGWRVSYPHKRGEEDGSIWVEKFPESWPENWQKSGYVIVKAVA